MEHISVIYNGEKSKKYKDGIEFYDCFLGDLCVGEIQYYKGGRNDYAKGEYTARVFECEDPQRYGWRERRLDHVGDYKNLMAARAAMLKRALAFAEYMRGETARKTPVAYLPSSDWQFYPTPSAIAGKLMEGVNFNKVKTMLEPSAGKGDLVECAIRLKSSYYNRGERYNSSGGELDCDCIEIDPDLRAILTGKKMRVVGDDFLSFNTRKRYDLILMNPPFAEGDLHLLHAIELCENGGQIACILNAETIKNPCTNTRRVLAKKLKELGASIRFVQNAFARAERKSDVEVALINISIPYAFVDETIWENLKSARKEWFGEGEAKNEIAPADHVERLIREHDLMCEAGISLMKCYNGIAPHLRTRTDAAYPMIRLSLDREEIGKCEERHVNKFLRSVRAHYWQKLFDLPELRDKMTSDMQAQYSSIIDKMCDYEFSKFNIRQVVERIMAQISVGVEDAIIQCFEKLSNEHSYNESVQNDNIHYFNGWKTNKAHYVNTRCIIPTWGCFATAYKQDKRGNYKDTYTTIAPNGCFRVLSDLEKALNYLDKGETCSIDLMWALEAAKQADRSRNIVCKYFTVTFYKKGTCHIAFHDKKIVDRLNIYVGKNKSWLPPSYGKVSYDEMDEESRRVVDEFQGREAYDKIMANRDDYLIDVKAIPLLSA